MDQSIPITSKWLFDSVGSDGRNAIQNVYMIVCPKQGVKGTGFLYKSGVIITNYHVVKDCQANEIMIITYDNKLIKVKELHPDSNRDLAILVPEEKLIDGLDFCDDEDIKPGIQVSTWGHPLGYNGPAPLLSVGYLSGFNQHNNVKHLIVNGAFNPGNSGGPLFISNTKKLIGVVVSKHAPIPQFVASAIDILSKNKSGVCYSATDATGKTIQFVESQIVAEILLYFRDMTQVMIGEAIDKNEVLSFLEEKSLR
jgi:hypothetical protein